MLTSRAESRPVVYIVDDDASLRFQVSAALGDGFASKEFSHGEEVLEALESRVPDLVLLDVRMPGLGGYETCRRIRAHPEAEFVPVLMMTGLEDDESMERAFEVGATDFILKPIKWALLAHRARYILRASRTLHSLRLEESKNRALLEAMPDTVLRIERGGRVLEAAGGRGTPESAFARSWVDRSLPELFPRIADQLVLEIEKSLDGGGSRITEVVVESGAKPRDYEVRISACGRHDALVVFRDVSERKRGEREIRRRAYHDDLTGLPNRSFLMEILERSLRSVERSGRSLAVLFVDLDGFKLINDSLGHHFGDELLKEASHRMGECLRSGDWLARTRRRELGGDEAKLARLGGDEFCVLLPGLREGGAAASVARRILAALSLPYYFDGHEVHVTASIGIALAPEDSATADQLLRHADSAMYHAKAKRSGSFEFYTASIGDGAERRLDVEVRLRHALAERELDIRYQPLVELASGRVVGAEALLRWEQPELGPISPNEFVPIAERTGLISEIGDWVLRRACREAVAWNAEIDEPVMIGVNVSGVQFRRPEFVDSVNGALREAGLDPSLLVLELTETTLMRDPKVVAQSMRRLRERGVRFAVDDFGTGYSSLSYVRDLPLDAIKLDGSFLRGLPKGRQSRAIATAVLGMAKGLDLSVVAEGVETEEQRRVLLQLGYHVGQGYLFRGPLRPEELRATLGSDLAYAAQAQRGSPSIELET